MVCFSIIFDEQSGIGTREEMCVAYLFYYPKVDLTWCASAPTQAQMAEQLSLKYR